MTIMDDFVKKTEEGIKTLKETAEGIAFNVEKQARMAGKKMDIVRIQRNIRKIYAEIGEYVHGEYVMGRPIAMETPFLKERVTSISEMQLDIGRIEAEMESLRKTQSPFREEPPGSEEKKA
jgi:hypothetical protein